MCTISLVDLISDGGKGVGTRQPTAIWKTQRRLVHEAMRSVHLHMHEMAQLQEGFVPHVHVVHSMIVHTFLHMVVYMVYISTY